ncbi:hypothetical protein [Mesobacillus subterraneus]|uniref:hypothetical protein n=1 Tax=Mesobacillus subterraneus TaxID=285983 RepID=UPI001B879FB9|nr:hypothetical protein [Mesobacillus subterraneus]
MKILNYVLITLFLLFNFPDIAYGKPAGGFVVYDGNRYMLSDEYVTEVERNIGKVTMYSDDESHDYYGDFSNFYPEGTNYYSIKGISTDEAIAVEDNGKYRKATWDGKSFGPRYHPFTIPFLLMVGLAVFMWAVCPKKKKKQ